MAAFQKFNAFVEDVAHKKHDLSMVGDQLTVALTLIAPVAGNSVLADLTEIVYTGLSARDLTKVSSAQTGGIFSLVLEDLQLDASGTIAPFRYVVVYNSAAPGGPLIGFYDYGSQVDMQNGESFTIDFTGDFITLQ